MNGAWNTEKESPRLQRFSGVSEDSSTGGTENMLCREREESSGGHFGANAYFYGRSNGDGAGYDIRKDMDYEHNESSNSSMGEGVGDLPATYVPFGARPKQIQLLKGYFDSEGEDNEDDEANFVSWQPQQQNKQKQRFPSRPNEAEKDQKHKQKPRDYEIDYEHRPWKRNPSCTSYSSKNSRGSKSSKTSRGSSASRKTPATHFSQYKEHHHHHHQQQQRRQQSNTATSIPPRQKLPMSSNDSQEDSVTSFLSQSIHSFESSDDSSVIGKEKNKTVKAKGNALDDKEGENSDSNHSPPSLDKISAIVDQVHREKQSRLASLQDGNVPVGKLPGGRTAAEPDIHADFGVDFSAGKNHGIGATSSFKRSFTGSHSVSISDRTAYGEEGERTHNKGAAINQSFNLSKLRNNKGKSFSSKDFDRRISLQKESSLRKVTVDVASIASREVEKFYSKRKQEKLEQKQLEMQQRRSDMRFSVGRSESVARLKQADLWSSLNLGESEVELMRKKNLTSSTSSYRIRENHTEDFNDSVDFGDDDAYEFERVVAEHEQESVGDTKGLGDDDRKVVTNLSSDGRDSNISLCGIGSPIGESDRYYEHQRENGASHFPPVASPVLPNRSSTFVSSSASRSHPTPQSYITSTAESAPTGRKPLLPTAEKLSPPSQSSSLPTVDKTSSQTAPSFSLPTIAPSSQTQTSFLPEAFSSDTLGTTITTQPLRNVSSSSTARYKKRTSLEMVLEAASRASMTGDGDDFAAYPIDEYEDPYDRFDGVVQNAASVNRAMSFTSYNSGRSYNSEPVPMKQGAFSTSSYVDRGTGGSGFVPTSSSVEAKSCSNAAVRRQSLPCKGSKATARRPARNKTIPSGDDYSHDGTNTSGGAGTVGGSVTFSYKDIYGSSEEDLNFISDFPSVMLSSAGATSSSQNWLENGVLTHAVEGNDVAGTSSDVGGVHASVNVGRNKHDEDDYGFGRRRSSNFEGAESDNARSSMVSIGLDKSNRSLGSSRQSFGSHTISADELDKLIEEEEEGNEPKDNKEKESTSWVKSLKRMSWLPVEIMQQHQHQPQPQQPKLKQRKTQSMYDLHDSDSDGSSKFGSSCSSFSSHSELSCFSNGDLKPMSKDKLRRRRERRRRRTQLNKRTSNLVKENPAPRSIRDILTSTNTGYDTEEEEDTVSVKSSLPSLAAAFGLDKELGKKSSKVPKRRGSHSSQNIQSNSVHSNASKSGQVSRQQVKQSLSEIQPMHPQQKKPSGMGVYFDDRGWRTGGVGYDTSEEDLLAGGMDFTSQSFECSKIADGTVDSTGWEKRLDQCDGDHDHGLMRDHEELDKIPQEPDCVNENVKDGSIHQTKRFTRQSVKSGQDWRLDQSDSSFKERIDDLRLSSMAAVEDEDPAASMGVAPKSEKMKKLLKMLQSDKSVSHNDANGSQNDPFALEIREECPRSVFNRDDGGNEHHCQSSVKNSALSAEECNSSEAKPTSDPPAVSTPPPKDGNSSMESKRDSNADNGPPSRRMSATSQTPSTQSSHSNTSQLSHSEDAQSSGLGEVGLVSAKSPVQSVVESSQSNQIQCKQVTRAEEETHHEDDSSSSPRSDQLLKTSQLSQRKNPQPNRSKDDSSTLHQQGNHSELSKSDHSWQTSTAATSSSLPFVDLVPSKNEDYMSLIYENDMPLSSGNHQPKQSFSSGLQVSSYPMSLHGGESKSNHSTLLLQDQLNEGSVAPTCLFQHSTLRHESEIHQILQSPHLCDCEDTTIDIYTCHHGLTTPLQSEVDTSSQSKSDRVPNSQPNFHDNAHNQFHHCEGGIFLKSSRLQHNSPIELLESPLSKIDASRSVRLEKLQFLHSDKSEQSNGTIDVKFTTQVRDDSLSVKSECLQNSHSNESGNNDSVSSPKQIIHQNEDEKKKLPFLQLFNKSNQQRHNSKESLDEGSDANPDLSIRLMSSSADLSQSCSSFGLGSKNGQPLLSRFKDHHRFDNSDDASKFWPAKDFDRNFLSNQSCENIISEGLNDSAGQLRNLFGIFAKKDCNNCTANNKINEGNPEGTREGSSEEIQTVNVIGDHVSIVQPDYEAQVVSLPSTLSGRTTDQKSELHQNMSIIFNSIERKTATEQSNESEAFLTRPRSRFLGRLKKGDHQNISHGKDQLYVISDTNAFSEGSDTDGRQAREYSSIDDTITLSHYSAKIDTCSAGKRNAIFGIFRKNRSNCSSKEGNMYDPCENDGDRQTVGTPNQQGGELSKNGDNINSAEVTMTSFSMIKGEELISSTTRSTDDRVNGSENENSRESLQKAFSTSATDPNNGTHGGNEADGAKQQISLLNRLQKNKSESEGKEDISRDSNEEPDQGVILSQLNDESLNLGDIELASTSQQFDGSQFSVCCALEFEVEGRNNDEMTNLCNASHSTGNSAALKSPNTNGFGGYSTSDAVENKPERLLDTDGCTCIKDCLSHNKGQGPGTSAGGDCDLNPQMKPIAINTSIIHNNELRSCCDFSDKASVDSDFYIGTVIVDTEHPDAEGHYDENVSYMDISNTQSSTAFLIHLESPISPNPHFDSDEATPSSAVSRSNDLTLFDSRNSIGDSDNVLSPGICDESMSLQEEENLRECLTNLTQNGIISEDIGDHDPGNVSIEEGLSGDFCPSTDSEDEDVFTWDEAAYIVHDEASDPSSKHEELQPSAGQFHRGTNFSENNAISHPVAGTGMNKGHICNIGSHPDSESKYSEDESSIDLTDVFSNFSSHLQPFIVGKDREEAQVAKTGDLSSDERKQKERDGNIFNNANDSKDVHETDATDTFLNIDDDSYGSSKSGGSVVWPKMFQNAQEVKDNDEGSFSTLHKQASQRSLVEVIFEDSDSGSDGNDSVVWPKVSIDSDPARQPSGQTQNAERNVSIEEYSQDSKYSAEYLVKTETDIDDSNISPESSPDSLHPSFRRQQSIKSIATMSTLDSLASPVDQMLAREQAAKGSAHHTMLLERQQSNSSFSSLESYASPTQFLRDNIPDPARNTLVNEEKTADDENALRHYREHYQDFHESNAHISAARKQSMTSELSYTYEIELRQEFSEQLDELSTSIRGRDSGRFSFRPGRKSSIDSDGSESLESRDIFKTTGTLEENNHFARSERSVVSRIEDLQASGFSNNFNMPGGSGISVYSTDGIEDIDPNATDEGRDDFDFAMEAYANAMKFGHLDQRENDLEDNDHALAAKAYTGLGFARQCKGELDGALDAYMKSLQLWENEVGQDDPDNWDLQFTIGTVLKEMQRQLEASIHFNNALHLLKSRNVASGIHKGSILCTEGMIFSVMDKIDRALDCFRKALLVFQNSHHPLNLKFATIMFEMGSLLSQCDDYDDSANCYKFALEIRKARLGDSFLVARTYYSLGVTLASQEIQSNISTTSSSHLEEALRICQVEFSQNNLQSAIIIHALGVLNERKGDFLAASVWFTKERNMRKALLGPDDESVAAVSSDLGTCYYNSGKYELAILLFRDSLRIKMLLDEDLESLEVADMLYKIASCHDSLCEYGEALHKFHEVKRIREAHYGPNSSPVVQAMLRIGNIQLGKGETKAALECFNEILGIGYANDSINAIEVANALYGRGCAQLCSFMLNDAMKSFTESLNWKLAALGEDDPGLACIFYQMAHVYLEQSDNEEAITCFEEYKRLQKLEKQRNLHDNAEICFAEGIVAKLQGRAEASLSFYKQALAMFETLFGDEHEKVASIHFEIGCVLASVGDHDSALDHYKLCLEKRRQLLGSHVDVASVLYEIAQVYNCLSNAPLAAEYLQESMEMWKSKLDRVEKLASVCQLGGKMWKVLRRHSAAQQNFEQALELYITIHGQHHETVATTLLDLGELLQEINQLQQALFCFDECMLIRTDLFGQDDPSVAEVLYSKGVAMLFHKNFEAANDCLSRSLAIREQKLGPKDGAVGDTLNTIGFLQLRMGNIQGDDALNFLNQALEIRKAVGNKSKVVSTLQNIASVYKKRKQYDLCTEVYSDILAVRQEEFGKNDERVADAWINLGNVQTNANRIVEATVSYEEALRIRTLAHSYNHKSVAQVLFKIGSLNSRLNRYAVAKQLFEEYIRIRAEEVDDPDEEMAQALTLMGDLQKETGEKSKAQINWMSAIEIYTQLGYPEDHPKVSKLKSRQSTIPTGLFGTNRKSISSLADMSFGLLG